MNFFRRKHIRHFLIYFTGIIFLNMSFFLAEVAALKLDKNNNLIENIARLISVGGLEEEREVAGEPCEGGGTSVEKIDLLFEHNLYHHHVLFLIAQHRHGLLDNADLNPAHLEIFSPPPEA